MMKRGKTKYLREDKSTATRRRRGMQLEKDDKSNEGNEAQILYS